jgi:diguanylate cyclase
MNYTEDVERAGEITRLVLPTLSRLGMPVNPVTFGLWYEYYRGTNQQLNAELEALSDGRTAYDPAFVERLYHEHILTPEVARLQRAGAEAKRLLTQVLELFERAGVEVGEYGKLLDDSAKDMRCEQSIEAITEMLNGLLTETERVYESNQRFQHQLHDTSEDISLLRQEIAEMREQVSLDPLTGVANRKLLDDTLEAALLAAHREQQSLCVMMVDIDHFKQINDEHGHLIGDKVIKYVAATLKSMVKGRDLVARYGGEEFAIILEETPREGAMALAEKIRTAIEGSRLKRTDTGTPIGRVTVSIGIGCLQDEDAPHHLIDRADRALYQSKTAGRNRVTGCKNLENGPEGG